MLLSRLILTVCTIFYVGMALLPAQQPLAQPRYDLVRVHFSATHDVRRLAALGMECDHGNYQPGRFLENVFSENELARIRGAGFACEVLIEDMAAHYLAHRYDPDPAEERSPACDGFFNQREWKTPANYTFGTMGGYHTLAELMGILDAMRAKFPHLISAKKTVNPTLNTAEGRPIYWLRISDNPDQEEPEPKALYTALHHAREPNSLSQLLFFMWYLLENYAVDPEIKALVDHSELYFVPCVNPDGYVYNQITNPSGGGFWRKNRNIEGGVDLNRNYGYEWGYDDDGSSPDLAASTYRGAAPFSEPETQALKLLCENHDFKVALNAHTHGNLLIYPYGFNNQPTPDQALFDGISTLMVSENNFRNGLTSQTVGYPANGSSDDWMYTETPEKGKILSMTPEVGPSFWPNPNQIDRLNKSMMWTNLTAARVLHHYGIVQPEPLLLTDYTGKVDFTIRRYGLQDGSLTVSLVPLSANVSGTGAAPVFSLAPLATASGSISFSLNPATQPGDEVTFLLTVGNGTIAHSDTLRGTFRGNSPELVWTTILDEPVISTTKWNASNGWSTTTQQFASAPASMTDTPNGAYPNSRDARLTLKNPVSLKAAKAAKLSYYAQWDIEKGFDYAQVLGSTDGVNFVPLCGKFTRPGSDTQDPGQPVYDGTQPEWLAEEIDLSDFIGGNLWLRFRMVSDAIQAGDGFYFDNLEVKIGVPPSSTIPKPEGKWHLLVSPNPASDQVTAMLSSAAGNAGKQIVFEIYDALGRILTRREATVGSQEVFQTGSWEPGLYIIRTEIPGQLPMIRRFLVIP